jgi:hypothetical protein
MTFVTFKPNKLDEAVKVYRDSVLPNIKKQSGFKDGFFLTDHATGKCIAISLWNTEVDMAAAESVHQENLAKAAPLVSGPPSTERYEVTVKG